MEVERSTDRKCGEYCKNNIPEPYVLRHQDTNECNCRIYRYALKRKPDEEVKLSEKDQAEFRISDDTDQRRWISAALKVVNWNINQYREISWDMIKHCFVDWVRYIWKP